MRNNLREALAHESRAYGFTIAFWGSGALLIKFNGLPSFQQALLYGFGAVVGFGLMTLYAYGKPFSEAKYSRDRMMVFGMIHYLAALVPIITTYYTGRLESPYNFFLTGVLVSSLYNLGMVVEEHLNEEGRALEKKLYSLI